MLRHFQLPLAALLLLAACSRRPNDSLITARIKAGFFSDPELKVLNLRVAADHGKVTLSGSVPSAEIKLKAFKVAFYTEGVATVVDDMAVAPAAPVFISQASQLAPAKPQPEPPPAGSDPEPEVRLALLPAAESTPPPAESTPSPPITVVVQPPAVSVTVAAPEPALAAAPVADSTSDPLPSAVEGVPPVVRVNLPFRRSEDVVDPTTLNAAGATFPDPLYERWFLDFRKIDSRVQIHYHPIGTGGGIRQVVEGRVDFAASDVPMTDQ